MIWKVFLLVPVWWLAQSLFSLLKNIRTAKSTGIPVVISPIASHNPLWMIFQTRLGPVLEKLPFGLGSFVRVIKSGWNYYDKFNFHARNGKLFALVSPKGIDIHVADAAVSEEIFKQKRDFDKPQEMIKAIDIYGPTVASTVGQDWQRHRRITATPFNERNNRMVWTESMRQTNQMVEYWLERGDEGVFSIADDTMTLALHVITCAGFGKSYQFRDDVKGHKEHGKLSYRDCLEAVLQNVLLIVVVPKWAYNLPVLPKKVKAYVESVSQLKQHMESMVNAVKCRGDGNADANFLSVLVQKSEEAQRAEGDSKTAIGGRGKQGLSDDELYGNFFIFSFAGHETTAHTLAYTLYHIAAFPEIQQWAAEEVKHIFKNHASIETLDYQELFPQLKRVLALMYETLRLYPPVLSIPKYSGNSWKQLNVAGRTIRIPPETHVYPNVVALQCNPEYWGTDPLSWNPSRWITSDTSTSSTTTANSAPTAPAEEKFVTPIEGSFVSWGDGPRVCPGKKFSQVEFVATMASLLWKYKLEVVLEHGETVAQARERVQKVIEDSVVSFTLQMRKPETVRVRLVAR